MIILLLALQKLRNSAPNACRLFVLVLLYYPFFSFWPKRALVMDTSSTVVAGALLVFTGGGLSSKSIPWDTFWAKKITNRKGPHTISFQNLSPLNLLGEGVGAALLSLRWRACFVVGILVVGLVVTVCMYDERAFCLISNCAPNCID